MRLTAFAFHADHGTIIEVRAIDDHGDEYIVACDRRMAIPVLEAIQSGEEPDIYTEPFAARLVRSNA